MTDSEKLDFLVEAVSRQEKRMDALEENLMVVKSELKEEIQGVRGELKEEIQIVRGELKKEIQIVRGELKEEVTGLKLVIDNEIRRNISIVAEGHLDLSRKLDEAIKGNQERETLMIRVNALETYVRELREASTM